MNRNEQIKNLTELLEDAASHLNYSMQRDGTPDEVYMGDVESLTAAIQALETQGVAEPERPKSREAKLLDILCEAVCGAQNRYDGGIAAALIQAWRAGQVFSNPLVVALLAPKLVWAECTECKHHRLEDSLYATMLKLMIPDVCPGVCQPTPNEEEQANDQN